MVLTKPHKFRFGVNGDFLRSSMWEKAKRGDEIQMKDRKYYPYWDWEDYQHGMYKSMHGNDKRKKGTCD